MKVIEEDPHIVAHDDSVQDLRSDDEVDDFQVVDDEEEVDEVAGNLFKNQLIFHLIVLYSHKRNFYIVIKKYGYYKKNNYKKSS